MCNLHDKKPGNDTNRLLYYANFVLTATHLWVDIIQWPNTTHWRQLFNLQGHAPQAACSLHMNNTSSPVRVKEFLEIRIQKSGLFEEPDARGNNWNRSANWQIIKKEAEWAYRKTKQSKRKQTNKNKNICWNYYWDFINNKYAISSGQ